MKASYYKSMTKKDFEQWITKVAKAQQRSDTQFTMYTGVHGMILFDLAMQGVTLNSSVRYSFTTHKKTHTMWLNMFQKHGSCKVRIRPTSPTFKLVCYYGTKEIGQATDLKSAVKLYNDAQISG